MSNVYRVNITCPRCQHVGDVEADFPCTHDAELAALRESNRKLREAAQKLLDVLDTEFDNDGNDWANEVLGNAVDEFEIALKESE